MPWRRCMHGRLPFWHSSAAAGAAGCLACHQIATARLGTLSHAVEPIHAGSLTCGRALSTSPSIALHNFTPLCSRHACRNHFNARYIFSKNDTGEAVKKRLGIDTQLYYFAANITTLDAHFFTAAELLLADEPALQRAARAMHALSWHFQPRHPEPAGGRPTGAGSSASAQASGQGQMAAPAGTGRSSTTSSPALLGRQLMPTGEPDAAAAKQANAAEAEARYVQPSGMQVGAACGWAGLQISDG